MTELLVTLPDGADVDTITQRIAGNVAEWAGPEATVAVVPQAEELADEPAGPGTPVEVEAEELGNG